MDWKGKEKVNKDKKEGANVAAWSNWKNGN